MVAAHSKKEQGVDGEKSVSVILCLALLSDSWERPVLLRGVL